VLALALLIIKVRGQSKGGFMKTNARIQSKRYKMFALLLSALVLSGCGAKKTARESFELSSRSQSGEGIRCNTFSSRTTTLDGRVREFVTKDGREFPDMMRIRITGITSQFDNNSKITLRIYRWKADSSGTHIDQEPLQFRLETPTERMVSGYMKSININTVTTLKSTYAVPGSTAQEFFNNVDILVFNVDYTWDALKIVLYEDTSATESRVVGDVDFLMPVFDAHPKVYAQTHPAVLSALHPFWSDRERSMDFAGLAETFCL